MRTAVVLAGGGSTRFGPEDKAVAALAGTPMIRRVVDRVTTVVDGVVVNCRDEQVHPLEQALTGVSSEVEFAVDPVPDQGPLAGIRTGLEAVGSEYAAVVACDMPFVTPGFVEFLFERARGHDAAVPRLEDGWFQTTQAVYRVEPTIQACEAALARGEGRIMAAVDALDVVVVTADEVRSRWDVRTFQNINTREELAAAAACLATSDPGGGSG